MNQLDVENLFKDSEIFDFNPRLYELDELYWFIGEKPRTETKENTYIMTMVTRTPRTIAAHDIAHDKSSQRIQRLVDGAEWADYYCTDGYFGYLSVIYPGKHIYNSHDKSDTFTVESINADLRHYIPLLARRSRCFARSLETLSAVVDVFVHAYNKFGIAKYNYRKRYPKGEIPFGLVDSL